MVSTEHGQAGAGRSEGSRKAELGADRKQPQRLSEHFLAAPHNARHTLLELCVTSRGRERAHSTGRHGEGRTINNASAGRHVAQTAAAVPLPLQLCIAPALSSRHIFAASTLAGDSSFGEDSMLMTDSTMLSTCRGRQHCGYRERTLRRSKLQACHALVNGRSDLDRLVLARQARPAQTHRVHGAPPLRRALLRVVDVLARRVQDGDADLAIREDVGVPGDEWRTYSR